MDDDMVAELLCQEPPLGESSFHDEDMLPSSSSQVVADFAENRHDSSLASTSSTCAFQLGHVCSSNQTSPNASHGSPQAVVDETSLQKQRDKNKMSLKVKLMLRRPVSQLVDQGIMPPPKTPSAFFEQRRHLERARTGDILKTKIEKRPDRQALVQQHILEDTRIAPSLHESQRKLKRARLQDYLNEKLSHRPGPLELVQGNILRLSSGYDNDSVVNPVIDGSISFRKTSEAESVRTTDTEPEGEEEDGSSSASSPTGPLWNLKDLQVTSPASVGTASSSAPASSQPDAVKVPPSPAPSIVSHSSCPSPTTTTILEQPPKRSNSLVQPDTSASTGSQGHPGLSQSAPSSGPSLHHRRSSKKSRVKPPVPQKTRTIKFHEYKGPPVTQSKTKNTAASTSGGDAACSSKQPSASLDSETPYDILLKQQQMFLQWQLEVQQKCNVDPKDQVRFESCADSSNDSRPSTSGMTLTFPAHTQPIVHVSTLPSRVLVSGPPEPPPPPPAPMEKVVEEKPPRRYSNPNDFKVNDLKVELKKRNLTVSGSKPQLLERLKNFLNANPDDQLSIGDSSPKSAAESPPEVKMENDLALSPISVSSENSNTQQLSFSQLDPVQQQQATNIALQTLAMQGTGNASNIPNLQNLQINSIPPVSMDLDSQQQAQQAGQAPHQTVHTIPTIFVATSQPTGNAFQSNCVPLPPNYVPYIITMNGLNSTLNLINGFNLGAVVNGNSEPAQKPVELPVEQTSTQKLQQHLQQKMLLQQMQREQKPNVSLGGKAQLPVENCCKASEMDTVNVNNQSFNFGYQPNESERMDTSNCAQTFDSTSHLNGHNGCVENGRMNDSFGQNSFMDGIKSEAIDDVLEILIRNGELPPSAAEGALPKSLILQHSKPLCKTNSSSNMFDRRLSNHQINDQPTSNYGGPLPPVSVLSNHGSPLSATDNNSDMNNLNQQLAFMEYLSQAAAADSISRTAESQQQYCGMDYTSGTENHHQQQPSLHFLENQMNGVQNAASSDENSNNGQWLDEWLTGPFLETLQDPLDQQFNFVHESNMQPDSHHHLYQQSMDLDNMSSMDHMFDMIFNDISGPNGATGFLPGPPLPASNMPMYWSDSDNML